MINFNNATFVKSALGVKDAPKDQFPEILFVGRSNVGKSSLINALTNHKKLAFTSSKPGHTKLLNYYNIDNKIYLVDAPGYGYAKGGLDLDALFAEVMDNYLLDNHFLKCVMLLIDSRREISEDDTDMINYFKETNIPYQIIATKKDKLNQKETNVFLKQLDNIGIDRNNVFLVSVDNNKLLNNIKCYIDKLVY